ncbi:unnamed protein product [Orchesella dallaii]|uniref:Uncharacterized protein n=1 Tax=Orchesella dallaii TaxID=48710 RepID=A0ABP1QNE0_9HEXA
MTLGTQKFRTHRHMKPNIFGHPDTWTLDTGRHPTFLWACGYPKGLETQTQGNWKPDIFRALTSMDTRNFSGTRTQDIQNVWTPNNFGHPGTRTPKILGHAETWTLRYWPLVPIVRHLDTGHECPYGNWTPDIFRAPGYMNTRHPTFFGNANAGCPKFSDTRILDTAGTRVLCLGIFLPEPLMTEPIPTTTRKPVVVTKIPFIVTKIESKKMEGKQVANQITTTTEKSIKTTEATVIVTSTKDVKLITSTELPLAAFSTSTETLVRTTIGNK